MGGLIGEIDPANDVVRPVACKIRMKGLKLFWGLGCNGGPGARVDRSRRAAGHNASPAKKYTRATAYYIIAELRRSVGRICPA